MIDPNGAYLFSKSGTWPNETYNFTLLEFNTFKNFEIMLLKIFLKSFLNMKKRCVRLDYIYSMQTLTGLYGLTLN